MITEMIKRWINNVTQWTSRKKIDQYEESEWNKEVLDYKKTTEFKDVPKI